MARFTNAIDGDRVQELVRIIIEGRRAKRKVDVLTWGLLAAEKVSDVLKDLAEINLKVSRMEQAELEFCTHAYRIVDNVIVSFYKFFVDNSEFYNVKEDLRQSLIVELFKLLKTYNEDINSSFAKYTFSALRYILVSMLFGDYDGDFSSANEKKFKTVGKSNVVPYEDVRENIETSRGYVLDIERNLLKEEVRKKVREAIESLPNGKERELLKLYFFEEKSRREICEILTLGVEKEFNRLYQSALKRVEKALDNAEFKDAYTEYRGIM